MNEQEPYDPRDRLAYIALVHSQLHPYEGRLTFLKGDFYVRVSKHHWIRAHSGNDSYIHDADLPFRPTSRMLAASFLPNNIVLYVRVEDYQLSGWIISGLYQPVSSLLPIRLLHSRATRLPPLPIPTYFEDTIRVMLGEMYE